MTHRSILLLIVAGTILASPLAGEEADPKRAQLGNKLYIGYCGSCHGRLAQGDGPVAEYLKIPPSDLTRISQRNGGEFPYERVYKTIDGREESILAHGSREMPIWGEAFRTFSFSAPRGGGELTVRRKIEDLIHFLQSIQDPYEKPEPAEHLSTSDRP